MKLEIFIVVSIEKRPKMGWNLHYFVASGPPCVLQMDDGFRGGALSHCGVFWEYFNRLCWFWRAVARGEFSCDGL